MAQANVSNSVLSIIASFANGLDVLKRLRTASHKKGTRRPKANNKKNASNALQLSHSLRRGADEIGREYQARSLCCDSERYAVGDAAAQSSLAEILVKLNTGLVGIITSFLNRDSPSRMDLDYQSLTNLSEHSRSQSIAVLRQLYQRIVSRRVPRNLNPASANSKTRPKTPETRNAASSKRPRARHPKLARVVIENSSIPSQIALVRPAESKKPRPFRTQSSERVETPSGSGPALPSQTSLVPPPPPYFPSEPLPSQSPSEEKRPRHHRSRASLSKTPSSRRLRQKHSVPLASSRPPPPSIDPVAQPPGQSSSDPVFEAPVKPALHRPRPTTLYSIASARTASTKLGEIPMDKWPMPWDFAAAEEANRLALEGGWPVVAGGEGIRKKGSGRWRRWFGRKGGVC